MISTKSTNRRLKALLLTTALLLSGIPIAGSVLAQAPADTDAGPDCALPTQDDKCEDWVGRQEGTGCISCSLSISPDGEHVYIVGGGVTAFDAQTGEPRWTQEAIGGQESAVTPDGETLVVAQRTNDDEWNYKTTAINATTGDVLWNATTDTPTHDRPSGIAVGPDSQRVYVTGTGGTLAYELATGEEVWSAEEGSDGVLWSGGGFDIFPSPAGDSVYVAVESGSTDEANGIVSLDASTGALQWSAEAQDPLATQVYSASLSPDGQTLVITGDLNSGNAAVVTAFDTEKRDVRWEEPMDTATGSSSVTPYNSVVGPDGQTVFVEASPRGGGHAYVMAFDASTGDKLWLHQEPGQYMGWLDSIAVSPDGSTVYMSWTANTPPGYEFLWRFRSDMATLALDAGTGEQQWKATYSADVAHAASHAPHGVQVAPDGSHVYVAVGDINSFVSGTVLGQAEPVVVAYEADGPDLELPSPPTGSAGR